MKRLLLALALCTIPIAHANAGLIATLKETTSGFKFVLPGGTTGFVTGNVFLTEPSPAAPGTISDEVRFTTTIGGQDQAVLISDPDPAEGIDIGGFDALGTSPVFVEPASGTYDYYPLTGGPGTFTGFNVGTPATGGDFYRIVSDCSSDSLCRVPEPSSLGLLAAALIGLTGFRLRARHADTRPSRGKVVGRVV